MKAFKLSLAALMVASASSANAGLSIENEMGTFNIGGDVEFDIDYRSREDGKDFEFQQGGRVLLQFDGKRVSASGYEAEFKVQPLIQMGGVALDDAYFAFGKVDGWNLKIGRFEAYDMFPNGQDTFLNHAGDSNNGAYSSGNPYQYHMKEARGRHDDGQVQYSQNFGNLYVEVATLLGERENFFAIEDGEQTHDSLMVRPVVAYTMGNFKLAAAMETDLTGKAIVNNVEIDMSDRIGYGLTGNYTKDALSVNLNAAYMDGINEENLSLGANMNLAGFGLGYYYTDNSYQDGNIADIGEGDVAMHSVYTSYEFKEVLGIEDFSVLPGAYYSAVTDGKELIDNEEDLGVRVRLKYYF